MKPSTISMQRPKWTAALLLAATAVIAPTPPAAAADWGVGVFFDGQGSTVAVPIRLESLMIEPEVTLFKTSTDTQDGRFVTLATGIYLRRELGPLFEAYYGGRIGYTLAKSDNATPPDTETRSWLIAPTFGVQHYLSKQFSLGLDVGLQYSNSEQKATTTTDRTDWNTVTRVLLRAYF